MVQLYLKKHTEK